MGQTGCEFWFEPQVTVEHSPDGWRATETRLGLTAVAESQELARRHLGSEIDKLLAHLLERGHEMLTMHFSMRGIPHRLTASTVETHPELDDDSDGISLEDLTAELRARHGA